MFNELNSKKSNTKNSYRPEIDGLRAFAVITVIINHFNKEILPGGYLGVDIFFVISGFVITSSLYERPSKNFKDFISGFYERRIKRLVPALSVFVLIMSITICLFNPVPGITLITGLSSLFGVSNIYLLKQATDYFANSTQLNIFTHTWSLGVEEQFYILYPLLVWFSGFGRQTLNGVRNLFLAITVLTTASLIGFLYLYPVNQPAAYFLMPTRFWEMASGCLLFLGFQKCASIQKIFEKLPSILVMAMIFAIMYLPMSFATISTVAVVILSALLIASLKKQTKVYGLLTNSKVVYIGLISYSLYLWHWGILSVSRWTIGIHWWTIPFQAIIIFSLANASYKYIETPLRKGVWLGKRWKTILVGGGVIVSLSSGIVTFGKYFKGNLFLGNKKISSQIGGLGNLSNSNFVNTKWSSSNCVFSTENDIGKKVNFQECSLSTYRSNKPTLLVIGNSQNIAQIRMYEKVIDNGFNVILTSAHGCHMPKRLKTQSFWQKPCNYYQENIVPEVISKLKKGDSVALISDFSSFLNSDNPELVGFDQSEDNILIDGNPSSISLRNYEFINGINKLAKRLDSMGISLIVQHMTPLTRGLPEVVECVSLFNWFGKSCTFQLKSEHLKARQDFDASLRELDKNNSNLFVFDPIDKICPDIYCSYLSQNGTVLYRDKAHFSDDASAMLSDEFLQFLRKHRTSF